MSMDRSSTKLTSALNRASFAQRPNYWPAAALLALLLPSVIPACASDDTSPVDSEGGTAGTLNLGGTSNGGSPHSGGTKANGGATNGGTTNGGTTNGGTTNGGAGGVNVGGAMTNGGAANGGANDGGVGAVATGGVSNGGAANGGAANGGNGGNGGLGGTAGSATGGQGTGGAVGGSAGTSTTGGTSTGGVVNGAGTAGVAAGGVSTGGVSTGGVSTGGVSTGGVSTGGVSTGGVSTGGVSTGGVSTGGAATGGVSTGGVATGGAATAGAAGAAGSTYSGPPSCSHDPQCNGESCCTTIDLPGGKFLRGRRTEACPDCTEGCPDSADQCWSNEQPEREFTLSPFKLDKYLVTVGRMKKFMESYDAWKAAGNPLDGAGAHPSDPGTGFPKWQSLLNLTSAKFEESLKCSATSTYGATNGDNYSVNCINWIQAFAFCIWDGGRLPSEAEWEFAAAGGSENRLYPWGASEPDATRAHFGKADPFVSVGSYPAGAGRWGHMDMAGLVWEWVYDVYSEVYYSDPASTCTDCRNTSKVITNDRVLRGGSYGNGIASGNLRAARRFGARPDVIPSAARGFRCAR